MNTQQVVLIYIYMGVSVSWSLSVLYVFVCVISEYQQKNALCVKLDALLHKKGPSGTKVPRLEMFRSTLSLSKVAL